MFDLVRIRYQVSNFSSVCLEEYMHFGLVENVLYAGSEHT